MNTEDLPTGEKPPFKISWQIAGAGLVVLIALGALWQFGIKDFFSLESIKHLGLTAQTYVADHPLAAMALYVGAYICIMCMLMPAAVILALLAGFLFGTWVGGALVLIAACTTATIVFLVTRSSLGRGLRARAGRFYTAAEREIHAGAASYILFIRLVPGIPFSLANIIPALFNVPLWTFLWTTLVGIMPIAFIMTNLGETLASIENMDDLFSPKLALALGLLALMALIPIVLRKIKARKPRNT